MSICPLPADQSNPRLCCSAHSVYRSAPPRAHILSNRLPKALHADIKKDYKDYWNTELSGDGKGKHLDYSVTLENADQIAQLRSSDF